MLLQDSPRCTRVAPNGDLVLLEDEDRAKWNDAQIRGGLESVEYALRAGPVGPYAVQAAIAAVHARAERAQDTDWREVAALYPYLMRVQQSPVVELNHAVAVAMADGLERGLQIIDSIHAR